MKISREDIKKTIKFSTLDELRYLLTLYGGPSKLCVRENTFDYDTSRQIQRMINDEIAYREIDNILLNDN
jgi:hypothetical protein